jgi:phage replication-related protein YjqB (UPF0714/DUF867 family)
MSAKRKLPEAVADKYRNFQELSQNHKRDVDYRIECKDRASPFSVIAIHGGKTEPMTSEIARAIAGDDFNYYLFESLQQQAWDLHVTSNNYDEPAAVEMVGKSRACISIHGFKESRQRQVCIGGLNTKLKAIILENLLQTGLIEQTAENPVDKFHAGDKANIVNRCIEGGVQIEISRALRDFLCGHPDQMKIFAGAIRKSISDYAALTSTPAPAPPKPKMGPF